MRAAVLCLALAACGGGAAAAPGPALPRGPIALTLPALDGGDVDLAAYRGKVVVLHVFTTWSLAATADVPQLIAAAARKDVTVIGVALDPEGRTLVSPWRRALSVGYLIALADDRFRVGDSPLGPFPAVPATLVLDRTGAVHARVDRQLARDELPRLIDEAARAR